MSRSKFYSHKRITNYDVQNAVKKIPKKDRIIDEKTFGHVVKAYFQNLVEALFDYCDVPLPHGMGWLCYTVVDATPYFDVKTGEVRGCVGVNAKGVDGKYVRVTYRKGTLDFNPFRFCIFRKGIYLQHRMGAEYKKGSLNSIHVKKL